jgi:hypothetical protein
MHVLFSVCYRINSRYMFRAPFAHHLEALYVQKLVYFVHGDKYARIVPIAVHAVPPDVAHISARNM